MKIWKKFITTILTIGLLASLFVGNVFADTTDYTYTITFLAGVQGTFEENVNINVDNENAVITNEGNKITVTGLSANDIVTMGTQTAVKMDADSKYYVKGLRLSGRDNDTVEASVFRVQEDADYVIAYGIKGDMVAYTVEYQDTAGNALAESQTFYGNVGDKPVVAYLYIEGYMPQVYGFTKTLSDNEAENVFTFVYDEVPEGVVPGEETPGTEPGEGTPGEGTPGAPGEGTPGEGTPGAPGETEPGEETPGTPEEEESPLVDIDEEDPPLANTQLPDNNNADTPMIGRVSLVAASVVGLVGLGAIAYFLFKKKKTIV